MMLSNLKEKQKNPQSQGPPQSLSLPIEDELSFNDDAWFATPELRAASTRMLLEISIHWQGIILDIAHYETPRRLTFGPDTRADFCYSITSAIEEPSIQSSFPLIEASSKGDFLLCFDTEMDGYIQENGEQTDFLTLVKEGRAHSFDRSGLCYYPLQPGAYVKITSQDTIIQIQFVPAPPISVSWFCYLNASAPVVSFSILLHLVMTCFAMFSIGLSSSSPTIKKENKGVISQPKETTKQPQQVLPQNKELSQSEEMYFPPLHLPSISKSQRKNPLSKQEPYYPSNKLKEEPSTLLVFPGI